MKSICHSNTQFR